MRGTAAIQEDMAILDIENDAWSSFVAAHPNAGPFHQPTWAWVLARCYSLRPRVAAVLDDHGAIVAGLPLMELGHGSRRRWVSLPFTDRCAPLVCGDAGSLSLAERLESTRRELRLRSVEVRERLGGETGWMVPQGHWHELLLAPGPNELHAHFHKSRVKGSLRRAEREGIVVERGSSRRDLCEVYYGLHTATRRRLGVPVQPRRFFDLLWERILEPGLGFLLIARRGRVPIASAVFLAANGRVTYKFSAADRRYAALGAGHAVLWEGIRQSCYSGARVFDFGRTESSNEGLRAFKRGWGAREEPLEYTVFAANAPRMGNGRAHAALGSVIRRSPPWVGWAIGELAYRFAA